MASVTKVFHVEFKGKHYYFGSKKAIFDVFGKEDIGITYSSFRNYPLSAENHFGEETIGHGAKCIIREGVLVTSPKKISNNTVDENDN